MTPLLRWSRRPDHLLFWLAVLVTFAPAADAQQMDGPVRRLRGIIDKDESWSGRIVITDDLKILGATVTVQPGCVIEFAYAVAGRHPVLTVGSEHEDRGALRLRSSAAQPITFRSRPDTNNGRIVVFVRNRIVPGEAATVSSFQTPPARSEPEMIVWRHIRFENLGHSHSVELRSRKRSRHQPCLTFKLIGRGHSVHLADCSFDETNRLLIMADDESKIALEANHFARSRERSAIQIDGQHIKDCPGQTVVAKNHAAAAIVLNDLPSVTRDNVLIGGNAAIVLRGKSFPQSRIVGNYVHNTTREDDGRYCLDTEDPNVRIEGNIFRGATTCVLNGSRHMIGNVFIGASDLTSPYARKSRTHQLVAALPIASTFEHNLLLGPAYSLLIPQPFRKPSGRESATGPTHIRHNVFDSFGDSSRAIHLNPIGRSSVTVAIFNNLFLRGDCLVYDEGGTSTTVIYADHNAYAPRPHRAFDQVQIGSTKQVQPGWAASDVQRDAVSELGLRSPPPLRLADYDAELEAGRRSIAQVRQALFDIYEPQRGSPLIEAGRRIDGEAATRPSIGAGR